MAFTVSDILKRHIGLRPGNIQKLYTELRDKVFHAARLAVILSIKRMTKMLIRLRNITCADPGIIAGGSRLYCQKIAPKTFFFVINLFKSGLFMVHFKENYNFQRFQGGPTFSRGGGGNIFSRRGGGKC